MIALTHRCTGAGSGGCLIGWVSLGAFVVAVQECRPVPGFMFDFSTNSLTLVEFLYFSMKLVTYSRSAIIFMCLFASIMFVFYCESYEVEDICANCLATE